MVAIHNKNGKGLLHIQLLRNPVWGRRSQSTIKMEKGYYGKKKQPTNEKDFKVAIHNKNGKGLLLMGHRYAHRLAKLSQSTIKMEKGYYYFYFITVQAVGRSRNPQ